MIDSLISNAYRQTLHSISKKRKIIGNPRVQTWHTAESITELKVHADHKIAVKAIIDESIWPTNRAEVLKNRAHTGLFDLEAREKE